LINKYSSIPLYLQLKNLILEKMENDEYPKDSRIPSEQELCEIYDISRPTVRQAIAELTNCGMLYKVKGKGTFVSKPKSDINIKNYSGFTDSILDSVEPGGKNIIAMNSIEITKHSFLQKYFNTGSSLINNNSIEIKYLTTSDDDILSLNVSYLPLNLFPNIIDDLKANKPSHEILKGKYPLLPTKSKSSLEVVYTDHKDAQYLQMQPGQPVIKIENILYSKTGQAVEYIISKYKINQCRLVFENSK
jgi:DNA-binding GntR family transcriptional regulator